MRGEGQAVQALDRLLPAPPRPASGTVRVLMVGDVIGRPGRTALAAILPSLREERAITFVTANAENAAAGMGLTAATADALFSAGVDVLTSGNHVWDKREVYPELERDERILRPLNYGADGVPGRGWAVYPTRDGVEIAVINVQGRTYMQPIDSPFSAMDALLEGGAIELPAVRIVDFHCEVTSEKNALGIYLDGRVSAVCGTHTHVVTADERILRRGTAYLSDIGMTGPIHSVIGFEPGTVLPRFITGLPSRFEVGTGPVVFNAVQVDIETHSGRARHIERVARLVEG